MVASTPAEDLKMKVMGLNIFPILRTFMKLQECAKIYPADKLNMDNFSANFRICTIVARIVMVKKKLLK